MISDGFTGITGIDYMISDARFLLKKGELSARYMRWQPTCISRIQAAIKSMVTILRSFERPESWPVAAKKVKNSAVVGIRIFVRVDSDLKKG